MVHLIAISKQSPAQRPLNWMTHLIWMMVSIIVVCCVYIKFIAFSNFFESRVPIWTWAWYWGDHWQPQVTGANQQVFNVIRYLFLDRVIKHLNILYKLCFSFYNYDDLDFWNAQVLGTRPVQDARVQDQAPDQAACTILPYTPIQHWTRNRKLFLHTQFTSYTQQ